MVDDDSTANGAPPQQVNGARHGGPDSVSATHENVADLLASDRKVKVAGVDADGVLRGKVMDKDKFLASIDGFSLSSAVFGWDMHDQLYSTESVIASAGDGYGDFVAVPDLSSFRRLPFEDNIPFFLVSFWNAGKPVPACGRSMLRSLCSDMARGGFKAMAGGKPPIVRPGPPPFLPYGETDCVYLVELEFVNFQTPSEDGYGGHRSTPNFAGFLSKNHPRELRPLTAGMFGYSATRPVANKEYFHRIFDCSADVDCAVESWHTESGPGVYEAASLTPCVHSLRRPPDLLILLSSGHQGQPSRGYGGQGIPVQVRSSTFLSSEVPVR